MAWTALVTSDREGEFFEADHGIHIIVVMGEADAGAPFSVPVAVVDCLFRK